ncbi:Acyl-CoA synthetase (AMP-forming)/AMP-acid ligase II [Geodermatophilus telluris]|uniref:Acyl-CoA synthetase (AMP-forming)/AMP-acid ligase II n=2 Tax=Geodermatophilus telluris TaxID=1190417 RepID=A0A1G6L959_9ACTN|nr:Acyl-CoA synthetase (AMP-forming)/AMP-acid ligase II [Geodermatophilus telluris]
MTDTDPGTADGPAAAAGAGSVAAALGAVVAARPASLAVTSPDLSLTYAELADRAAACARRLRTLTPETVAETAPVAVLGTPSAALVVAMVGVVLSGRPLVVLDSQLPVGRLQQIQEMAGAALCLAEPALRDRVAGLRDAPVVADLHEVVAPGGEFPAGTPEPDGPRPALTSPATIVFTSGSTGRPKGVVHSHGLVLAEAALTARHLGIGPGTRVAQLLPPSFSLGEHCVFGTLLAGGSLHVLDPRAAGIRGVPDWLRREGVQVTSLTPSLLRAVAGATPDGEPLDDLRLVACAGEALQARDVRTARERLGPVTVVNGLGSSETCQITFLPLGPEDPLPDGAVPAGRPVETKDVEVVDGEGRVLPPGEVGGLRVTAPFLSSYLDGGGDVFRATDDGRQSFRMGDRARFDEAGVLHVLGRADDAVKVGGYLVEPAEVEAALRGQSGVADAAVLAVPTGSDARLVGYAVPDGAGRTPSPAQLRRGLVAALPSWMVPAEIRLLGELPRTERGKVDRGALPRPAPPSDEPPQGEWERRVAELFATVLGRRDVGRDVSLTSLGGDSLTVEELLTRMAEQYGVVLSTSDVAEAPTVRELAAVLAAHGAGSGPDAAPAPGRRRGRHGSLVALRATGERPPVLCFAGAGAGGQAFLPLADALGPDQPVFAFQPHGLEEWALPDLTVRMAARRHLRRVRELQPSGPYRLVGHSMGGLVALQVARLLTAAGEDVRAVTLIDTFAPPSLARRAGLPSTDGKRSEVLFALSDPPVGGADDATPPPRELWRRRVVALLGPLVRPSATRMEGLRELGVRTSLMHRPQPWSGRVRVYVSHLNPDDPQAWRALLPGPIDVVTLNGDHNSLLRSPHVEEIARGIAEDDDR